MNSKLLRLGLYSLQISPFIIYRDLYEFRSKKIYTLEEIRKHNTKNDSWVIYNNKVYNITQFIDIHPGGKDMIMQGSGKDIQSYWNQYPVHFEPKVTDILEKYYIGELDGNDIDKLKSEESYNYNYNYDHNIVNDVDIKKLYPLNVESKLNKLIENYITPSNFWYIRNHHDIPNIDIDDYILSIELPNKSKKYSLNDLKKFPKKELVSTIQCAGNRRDDFNILESVLGLKWTGGAISTGKFTGVLLRDVLEDMELDMSKLSGEEFVQLFGIDNPFDGSIPISKVLQLNGDVLLAYEMNGETLTPSHGYPLRIIVPGYTGAKNIKWLNKIVISNVESPSTWQKGIAYKGLPSNIKSIEEVNNLDISKIPTIETLPIQSIICNPSNNEIVNFKDKIKLEGIAYSGEGKNIVRVEISTDNGSTWTEAILKEGSEQPRNKAWAWTFWELEVDTKNKEKLEIWCRAVDSGYNTQPENIEDIWNLRGILNNSWHKISISNK